MQARVVKNSFQRPITPLQKILVEYLTHLETCPKNNGEFVLSHTAVRQFHSGERKWVWLFYLDFWRHYKIIITLLTLFLSLLPNKEGGVLNCFDLNQSRRIEVGPPEISWYILKEKRMCNSWWYRCPRKSNLISHYPTLGLAPPLHTSIFRQRHRHDNIGYLLPIWI